MSLIIAIALASAPAATTQDPRCENAKILRTGDVQAPTVHKLEKEPPARHIFAVVRSIDGCNIPVSVQAPRRR